MCRLGGVQVRVPHSSPDGRVHHSSAQSAMLAKQRRYYTDLTTAQSTWFVRAW